ncbi:nitrate/nitrite transporter [Bowmanella dokdonensis]|uniref:MFS transporter n=1 Tax=Bowmanella dokdonensis TaxID=751969 RepID=A0A939DKB5_9ALTE|nr:MFS transporter [Bowmanella dokdonensis]MBN7824314.1 MFS transporter [Bowmanella dokdonensis]
MIAAGSVPASAQRWALWLSTLSFTLCFAVWTLFSILGIRLKDEFGLSDTELGLLMATPILTGAISRLFLGLLTDRYGGRQVFSILMLATSVSVFLLSLADSYLWLLVSALGVGLAGGGFIVGVTYISAWYEKDRQGTALGIFGAGNVGAALTSFAAPFVLLALGWQDTARIYAVVMVLMAVIFFVWAKPDPGHTGKNKAPVPLSQQLLPLTDLRVWSFSLYYFFVFGAFVALALWLPHYLMQVYGLSLATAGILAALYSIPASLFRILGGWLSDKYGARAVMYWTLIASVLCTFLLSYPPTRYQVRGVTDILSFSLEMPLVLFALLTVVLGFFMSLGKAAVFKHIPVYYPGHVGVVGGVVGMVGGLGGFLLPLTFGMLNDLVGVWQSCFMLLFIVCTLALLWMHFAIRRAERQEWQQGTGCTDLPEMSTPQSGPLHDWRPEDRQFWLSQGRRIASRNLWISIPNLFVAFAVWSLWSILVVKMPVLGFPYSQNQLFWLAALPALSGATFRLFFAFMVPLFGGRRWTALSTLLLLVPCLWMAVALQDTSTSYLTMLILALLCGLGGGNFASSMANISFFYPAAEKGAALGLNAGLGNLGVSAMQMIVPLVIATSLLGEAAGPPLMTQNHGLPHPVWLQNAALIWIPLILLCAAAAWYGMHDIDQVPDHDTRQLAVFRHPHAWLMSWLYLGSFGSFIGFYAAFPLLCGLLFEEVDPVKYAFIGPLAAALARPFGGVLADRLGGATVTLYNFVLMMLLLGGIFVCMPSAEDSGSFTGFFFLFMLLFIASGIGNGSTFKMVPIIFMSLKSKAMGQAGQRRADREGSLETAAVLGLVSAVGAYGGFFIPKAYGTSLALTGSVNWALYAFMLFYASCVLITWRYYARPGAPVPC